VPMRKLNRAIASRFSCVDEAVGGLVLNLG
jgi:hypothetical protein